MKHLNDARLVGIDPEQILERHKAMIDRAEALAIWARENDQPKIELQALSLWSRGLENMANRAEKLRAFGNGSIPRWEKIRDAILDALRHYPEAQEAVVDAISRVQLDG